MIIDIPLFLTNADWYYEDQITYTYKLTELGKSLPDVVKSYNDFYNDQPDTDE